MSKRIAWGLLKMLPTKNLSFQEHINVAVNGNRATTPSGSFMVEVEGQGFVDLTQRPTNSQLTKPWNLFVDQTAEREIKFGTLQLQLNEDEPDPQEMQKVAEAEKLAVQRFKRVKALLEMKPNSIPSLEKTEIGEDARLLPGVFTKCEVSRVVQLPRLPSEGTFLAEMDQLRLAKHLKLHAKEAGEAEEAKEGKETNLEAADEAGIAPNNNETNDPYTRNFHLKAKRVVPIKGRSTDGLLREGVARVVYRIMEKDNDTTISPSQKDQFGLGVVSEGRHIVFVRVDLRDEAIPVYVSEVLQLNSEQSLHYLARSMCCYFEGQFGLPAQDLFTSLQLPRIHSYAQAYRHDGYADKDAACEEAAQYKLACTLYSSSLGHEAEVLEKLRDVSGVPKIVSCFYIDKNRRSACALLTTSVGTPLDEHMKSLHGEGERHSFAQRVLEQLKLVLSAAHAKGIVHGNIQPKNLVVAANGDVILTSWGGAVIEGVTKELDYWQRKDRRMSVLSNELLLDEKRLPTPHNDLQALLLTFLTIRESPAADPPWSDGKPYSGRVDKLIKARSQWVEEYMRANHELDLTSLL